MRYLGGHLGIAVSALLDGHLDTSSAERAWAHVHGCALCHRQVEREGWVKTQLAAMTGDDGPPPQLLGSLYGLGGAVGDQDLSVSRTAGPADGAAAWMAVEDLERRGRGRRRTGIVLVGAGSVSAAVLGFASLTGSPLGIGGGVPAGPPTSAMSGAGTPTATPASTLTTVIAPSARVHGWLHQERREPRPGKDAERRPGSGESPGDLRP